MTSIYTQIRDPIHGVIFISQAERAIIESKAFQRLRNIKQVGFLDFAFPCASHSRYCHSLGAMSFASRIFKRVVFLDSVSKKDWERMHQAVRLAALLHDIGHPPLSHTTEMILPMLKDLDPFVPLKRQATHEDYTLRIILQSELTAVLKENFNDVGLSAAMVASLLNHEVESDYFVINGLNFTPLLRQIISSEIDADRMDYLLRDSFFCGVNYGKFDSDWLIENLVAISVDGSMFLGLKSRAIFAFEDFLLSRYHMFASVYLHHTPVIMEKMLERYFVECPQEFSLPKSLEAYLELNDMDLWQTLRKSQNTWAQRIITKTPYVVIYEHINRSENTEPDLRFKHVADVCNSLKIPTIFSRSKSVLSKYFNTQKIPLYVEERDGTITPLDEYSSLFVKYQRPTEIVRIYVDPAQKEKALEHVNKQ